MRVRDEAEWAKQLSEFEQDDMSKKFGMFLVEWIKNFTTSHEIAQANTPLWFETDQTAYAQLVSNALKVTEQTFGQFIAVEWIGQMLVVIGTHWAYGEQMYDGLSFIEKRLYDQAVAMKLVDLQIGAAASITTEE